MAKNFTIKMNKWEKFILLIDQCLYLLVHNILNFFLYNILNLLDRESVGKKIGIYMGLKRGYNRKITCKNTLS
jgi:hypothetical protein